MLDISTLGTQYIYNSLYLRISMQTYQFICTHKKLDDYDKCIYFHFIHKYYLSVSVMETSVSIMMVIHVVNNFGQHMQYYLENVFNYFLLDFNSRRNLNISQHLLWDKYH